MKNQDDFFRINNDVNGNPRYVTSWLGMGYDTYEDALKACKSIGGKKFHNKQFGGGIAFQSYSLPETCKYINNLAKA